MAKEVSGNRGWAFRIFCYASMLFFSLVLSIGITGSVFDLYTDFHFSSLIVMFSLYFTTIGSLMMLVDDYCSAKRGGSSKNSEDA